MTLAWLEDRAGYESRGIRMAARADGEDFILAGTKVFVPDAAAADTLIVAARTDGSAEDPEQGLSLFLVEAGSPGMTVTPLQTMAGDKQYVVEFDQVRVPGANMLGRPGGAWGVLKKVLFLGAVAKSAEMAGGARRVMELVVPYTKERVQFGRPVGAFQAVQHHCANMLTYAETMEFMVFQAAWRIGAGLPFEREAAMCKAWVNDAYRELVALGHQVMGGIGFMEEHDLQLYYKRAKAAESSLGDTNFHLEFVAQAMGL